MNRLILGILALSAASPVAVMACGGKTISVGVNASTQTPVDPTKVATTVSSSTGIAGCASGSAHPNICCPATAGQGGNCVVAVGQPFLACEEGWNAYPDSTQCCDLATGICGGPSGTVPPGVSSSPGSDPSDPNISSPEQTYLCGYPCQPGWFQKGSACCLHDPAPAPNAMPDQCESGSDAVDTPPSPVALPPSACAAGSWLDTHGTYAGECCSALRSSAGQVAITCMANASVPPAVSPSTPTVGPDYCPLCPTGFTATNASDSSNRGVVCCSSGAQGQECFSQAGTLWNGPMTGVPTTSTTEPEMPRSCTGSASTNNCECGSFHSGHGYELTCMNGVCTCAVDGHQLSTMPGTGASCTAGLNDPWSSAQGCGFP